jgi:hypothetical protein
MFAPVYRHLDTKATFLGLSFPVEWIVVLLVFFVGAAADQTVVGILGAASVYALLRIVAYGRPENFLQTWIVFQLRALSGGHFSGAARSRAPRFPFGAYALDARLQRLLNATARAVLASDQKRSR